MNNLPMGLARVTSNLQKFILRVGIIGGYVQIFYYFVSTKVLAEQGLIFDTLFSIKVD